MTPMGLPVLDPPTPVVAVDPFALAQQDGVSVVCHLLTGWDVTSPTLCGASLNWGLPASHDHAASDPCRNCGLPRCRQCRALAEEGVGASQSPQPIIPAVPPTSGPAPSPISLAGPDTPTVPSPSPEE